MTQPKSETFSTENYSQQLKFALATKADRIKYLHFGIHRQNLKLVLRFNSMAKGSQLVTWSDKTVIINLLPTRTIECDEEDDDGQCTQHVSSLLNFYVIHLMRIFFVCVLVFLIFFSTYLRTLFFRENFTLRCWMLWCCIWRKLIISIFTGIVPELRTCRNFYKSK